MTVNAVYRCTHGTMRSLVTMGILGTVTVSGYTGYTGKNECPENQTKH